MKKGRKSIEKTFIWHHNLSSIYKQPRETTFKVVCWLLIGFM